MSDLAIELRLGRYQDALADVECDAVITDPPYGARTHAGQRHGRKAQQHRDPSVNPLLSSRGLNYQHWTAEDVAEFVAFWSTRCKGWICALTSHDLVPAYADAFKASGLYSYAPIACVQRNMNVRLAGDGPSNWTTWLVVARPRWSEPWGALPGAYVGEAFDPGENSLDRSKRVVPGGKPLWLMQCIVRDYSRPGQLVVDPCAGGATTLAAAAEMRRAAIGAEVDPATHAAASARLQGRRRALAQSGLFDASAEAG